MRMGTQQQQKTMGQIHVCRVDYILTPVFVRLSVTPWGFTDSKSFMA